MERRALGRTGARVGALGFGAATLGQEYGPLDDAAAERVVRRALERGFDFFDVAPYYGRGLAEERLGRALAGRRDEVFLATKCCRYGHRGFDFSAARVHADVDASLARLRTDHLDLLQVHDVEFGRSEQLLAETLPALRAAQRAGKTRFVGITGLPLGMLRRLAESFPVDTLLSYCHGNLLANDLDARLGPLARERGLGLINASPLHMGVLAGAAPPAWHPAPPEVLECAPRLVEICRRRGRELPDVALRYALDLPGPSTTLVGLSSQREVDAAVAALERPNDPELLEELEREVAPVLGATWHEGRPENRDA